MDAIKKSFKRGVDYVRNYTNSGPAVALPVFIIDDHARHGLSLWLILHFTVIKMSHGHYLTKPSGLAP